MKEVQGLYYKSVLLFLSLFLVIPFFYEAKTEIKKYDIGLVYIKYLSRINVIEGIPMALPSLSHYFPPESGPNFTLAEEEKGVSIDADTGVLVFDKTLSTGRHKIKIIATPSNEKNYKGRKKIVIRAQVAQKDVYVGDISNYNIAYAPAVADENNTDLVASITEEKVLEGTNNSLQWQSQHNLSLYKGSWFFLNPTSEEILEKGTRYFIDGISESSGISINRFNGNIRIRPKTNPGVYKAEILGYGTNEVGGSTNTSIQITVKDDLNRENNQLKYNIVPLIYGFSQDFEQVGKLKNVKEGIQYELMPSESKLEGITIDAVTGTLSVNEDFPVGNHTIQVKVSGLEDSVYEGEYVQDIHIKVYSADLTTLDFGYGIDGKVNIPLKSYFDISHSTLPEKHIVYKLEDSDKDIIIDENTGRIRLGQGLADGEYSFAVTAVGTSDGVRGLKTSYVTLNTFEILSYKGNMPENTRKILSIGDLNTPFLFDVKYIESDVLKNKYTTKTTISGVDNGVVYYRDIEPRLLNRDVAGHTGVGISANYENWRLIEGSDYLKIKTVMYRNNEHYYTHVLVVKRYSLGRIYTWRDLQEVYMDLSRDYVLVNDIEFPNPGEYGFSKKGFFPIGGTAQDLKSFSGSLDGNGKVIRNLYINRPTHTATGLFGGLQIDNSKTASKAIFKNLKFENVNIIGGQRTGVLAGIISLSYSRNMEKNRYVIDNVKIIDGIISGEIETGGMIGHLNGAFFDVYDVMNTASVIVRTSDFSSVGGLIGKISDATSSDQIARTTVSGYMEGAVSGYKRVGGLVGDSDTASLMGYMLGKINVFASETEVSEDIGGLVGTMGDGETGGELKGYMAGEFHLDSNSRGERVGGLVGSSQGGRIAGYVLSDIKTGKYSLVGGLVGQALQSGELDEIVGFSTGEYSSVSGVTGALFGRSYIPATGYWDATLNNGIGKSEVKPEDTQIQAINDINGVKYNPQADNYFYENVEVFKEKRFIRAFELPKTSSEWPVLKGFKDSQGNSYEQIDSRIIQRKILENPSFNIQNTVSVVQQ